jgi:hypothetical protein
MQLAEKTAIVTDEAGGIGAFFLASAKVKMLSLRRLMSMAANG